MKLSIIVPIYNTEKFLRGCIDSILAQAFTDFELILVDDGSTDSCLAICDCYAKKDPRIVVIHKKNGGLSEARNAGLDIARGEYIGFVDSDDYIHPAMYDRLFSALLRHSADIAVCNCLIVNEYDAPSGKVFPLLNSSSSRGMDIICSAKEHTINTHFIVVWGKIYARGLWNDLRFPVGKIHEDEYVFHRLFSRAEKVVSIEDQMYYYRQTPGSIINKQYNVQRLDYFGALADRTKYFLANNLSEEAAMTLTRYFDDLRCKYFLISNNKETKNKLYEVRKSARSFFLTYLKICNDIWTVKFATLIFLYCPKLYKFIWLNKKNT